MSEKEFLMDILETEKNMTVNITYALNEASSAELYEEFSQIFTSVSKITKDLFAFLYEVGYYPLEQVEQNKITVALDTFKKALKK